MIEKKMESPGYLFSVERKEGNANSGSWDGPGKPRFAFEKDKEVQENLKDAPETVRRLAIPGVNYDGKTYQLTKNDEKAISSMSPEQLKIATAARVDAMKESLGKRYGLKKREEMRQSLKPTKEYRLGLGQGKLDSLNDLPYTKERNDPASNMGYYQGYNSSKSNLRSEIDINPNFYLSKRIVVGH